MKDLYSSYRSTFSIKPQTVTSANADGTGIDLLGYTGALMICHTGASGALLGGSNYVTIAFVESANNVVFSAIADTDLIGGNNTVIIDANSEANSTHQRSYVGAARYVAIQVQTTAGAVSLPVCAEVVRGIPLHAPIS
jgi:hypothetical protein